MRISGFCFVFVVALQDVGVLPPHLLRPAIKGK